MIVQMCCYVLALLLLKHLKLAGRTYFWLCVYSGIILYNKASKKQSCISEAVMQHIPIHLFILELLKLCNISFAFFE